MTTARGFPYRRNYYLAQGCLQEGGRGRKGIRPSLYFPLENSFKDDLTRFIVTSSRLLIQLRTKCPLPQQRRPGNPLWSSGRSRPQHTPCSADLTTVGVRSLKKKMIMESSRKCFTWKENSKVSIEEERLQNQAEEKVRKEEKKERRKLPTANRKPTFPAIHSRANSAQQHSR